MPSDMKAPSVTSEQWRQLADACNYFSDMGVLNSPMENLPLQDQPLSSPPFEWSRAEVAFFIEWCAKEFDLEGVVKDKFKMNGKALCILTKGDISQRAPEAGDVIYNVLQRLLRQSKQAVSDNLPPKPQTSGSTSNDDLHQPMNPVRPIDITPGCNQTYCAVLGREVVIPSHVDLPSISGPLNLKIRHGGKKKRRRWTKEDAAHAFSTGDQSETSFENDKVCNSVTKHGKIRRICQGEGSLLSDQTECVCNDCNCQEERELSCNGDCNSSCDCVFQPGHREVSSDKKDDVTIKSGIPLKNTYGQSLKGIDSQGMEPISANPVQYQIYQAAMTPQGFIAENLPSLQQIQEIKSDTKAHQHLQLTHLMSFQQQKSLAGGEIFKSVSIPAGLEKARDYSKSPLNKTSIYNACLENDGKIYGSDHHRQGHTIGDVLSPKLRYKLTEEGTNIQRAAPANKGSEAVQSDDERPVSPLLVRGRDETESYNVPYTTGLEETRKYSGSSFTSENDNTLSKPSESTVSDVDGTKWSSSSTGNQPGVIHSPAEKSSVFDLRQMPVYRYGEDDSQSRDGLLIDERAEGSSEPGVTGRTLDESSGVKVLNCTASHSSTTAVPMLMSQVSESLDWSPWPLSTQDQSSPNVHGKFVYPEHHPGGPVPYSDNSVVHEQRMRQEVAETMTMLSNQTQLLSPRPDQGQPEEGKLLWEFLCALLQEPKKYRDVIVWENEPERIFKIRSTDNLARLWGTQKQKQHMTYEKLSRSLRYYYRVKIISKVPGRRLTYRFDKHPNDIVKGQRGAKPGVPHAPRGSRQLKREQKRLQKLQHAQDLRRSKTVSSECQGSQISLETPSEGPVTAVETPNNCDASESDVRHHQENLCDQGQKLSIRDHLLKKVTSKREMQEGLEDNGEVATPVRVIVHGSGGEMDRRELIADDNCFKQNGGPNVNQKIEQERGGHVYSGVMLPDSSTSPKIRDDVGENTDENTDSYVQGVSEDK